MLRARTAILICVLLLVLSFSKTSGAEFYSSNITFPFSTVLYKETPGQLHPWLSACWNIDYRIIENFTLGGSMGIELAGLSIGLLGRYYMPLKGSLIPYFEIGFDYIPLNFIASEHINLKFYNGSAGIDYKISKDTAFGASIGYRLNSVAFSGIFAFMHLKQYY